MGWWADWWDSLAAFFGYDVWVWGSVGEWFAAIGTFGAIFATLFLFRSDRAANARLVADEIVTSVTHLFDSHADKPYRAELSIQNISSAKLVRVEVMVKDRPDDDFVNYEIDQLESGQHARYILPLSEDKPATSIYLYYVDRTGKSWFRDVVSGKYISNRRSRRIMMSAGAMQSKKPNRYV